MGKTLHERIGNLGETCGQTLDIGRTTGSLQNKSQETYRPALAHAAFHLAEPKEKLNE